MKEWVLILTYVIYGSPPSASGIASVPGFLTRESCHAAGNAWVAQAAKMSDRIAVRALCAERPRWRHEQ